jgi:small-conductance mechanosensitive channel
MRRCVYADRLKRDIKGTPQFGLIAEEVAEVSPDLITHNAKRGLSTVRYEAVNAMLLNEFLKEHKPVQEQGATIKQQRKGFETAIAQQQKQIDALSAALQKVSARLEVSKSAPQTVLNNQ